jgi:8-oxo-dGTP pyrophosphatase MutT (NUDIX family)
LVKLAGSMADIPLGGRRGDEPTPAATVVPLRDGEGGLEVLLLRRNTRGEFGGMWVFPGGKVDAGDKGDDGEVAAARRAAVREAHEEAGLVLDEHRLVVLSFWLPPVEAARRFATWFFLAPAGAGDVLIDGTEVHEHRWLKPQEAMAARNAGEIQLAPPTFTTLWWASGQADANTALAAAAGRPPERYHTHLAMGPDGALAATVWQGDAAYADGDLERPGRRRRLWMTRDGWRVEVDH